ncbi:ABC transporter permease [bacterium]|nr:MAG: ABC transporter permease [bacterium]
MLCELWLSQRYLKKGKRERIISFTGLISMVGIAIGVMVLIVVIAVMSGFDNYLQDKMVGTNSHILLEFYSPQAPQNGFVDKITKAPHVLAASPYISGQAFLKIGSQVIGLEMRGVDPVGQVKVSKIGEYVRQGTLNIKSDEIVLGQELASRLGLRLDDKIGLISPATLKVTEFKIKGLFNSGMYLYDSSLVITDIKGAQGFFNIPGSLSGIAVKVDNIYKVDNIKENLYKNLGLAGSYQIRTWVDTNKSFLDALKLEKIVMFIVVTMTTVVAAFGIVGSLIMSVMSKVRDIGILRSVGANAASILQIFLFQGLALGIGGILLGLLGGVTLALSLNRISDFISGIVGHNIIPQDIYYFDRIPTQINISDINIIVISALVITLAASIYPAYYAARINPSEALRHE